MIGDLGLNLTDTFVYLMLLANFILLGLYWMISLLLTVLRSPEGGMSLLNHRSFFQFVLVNVFLVANAILFYLFIRWNQSHTRPLFEKDDLYPFIWMPLNLLLIVGLGEIAYRKFSKKNARLASS